MDCLGLLALLAVICVIAAFWKDVMALLTLATIVGVLVGIGKLVWSEAKEQMGFDWYTDGYTRKRRIPWFIIG